MENMKNERSILRSPIPSQKMSLRLRERLTNEGFTVRVNATYVPTQNRK